jgi:hypothetical protein
MSLDSSHLCSILSVYLLKYIIHFALKANLYIIPGTTEKKRKRKEKENVYIYVKKEKGK